MNFAALPAARREWRSQRLRISGVTGDEEARSGGPDHRDPLEQPIPGTVRCAAQRHRDWSKEAENPLTRHITLPLRYEAEFQDGADKLTKSTFEIDQAVVPFRLNDDWALITRTKLPAEVLPPKNLGDPWVDGLSNGYTTFFLSPEHGTGFYWGAGPVLYYPTATNSALGVNKWGSGPSVAFLRPELEPVGIRRSRQQYLVLWRPARQQ